MIVIEDKSKCCGCSACVMSCPTKAISMKSDEQGFSYPHADPDKCIKCGKCNRCCPILNESDVTAFQRKVYMAQNADLAVRLDSTSGGAFSAIAQHVIENNGYVFGAELDNNWKVVHGYGNNMDDLSRFRGSKYVQSELKDTFRTVKKLLDEDKLVLFTGTPCQVEGLTRFLGRQYATLYLMDIVCFSISSPLVWKLYLQYLEKERKIDLDCVSRIKFRDKARFGYEYSLMTFYDKNGKVLYSSGPETNKFLRSFVSNTSVRPSCFDCRFKKVERVSDFTVWDCYDVYKNSKTMDDNNGTSHIMVQSIKGESLIKKLGSRLNLIEVDIDEAVKSEPAITESAKPGDNYVEFFQTIKDGNNPFDLYFRETFKTRINRFMRESLSVVGLYKHVKRIVKDNGKQK